MKIFKDFVLIYLVALLSATLLLRLSLFHALPNLILILALLFIFKKEVIRGLLWAILGGFFLDLFSFKIPLNTFLVTAIILLDWFLIERFFETSNILLFLIFCCLNSLVYDLIFLAIFHLPFSSYLVFLNALYGSVCGLIVYLLNLYLNIRSKKGSNLVSLESR